MSECIDWHMSCSSNGYGQIWYKKKMARAHRYIWEQANGEIPKGLVLDHLCRNRKCVNLEHLELVTQSVNVLRGLHSVDQKPSCPQGHPYIAKNILVRKNGHRECAECNRVRARASYQKKKVKA